MLNCGKSKEGRCDVCQRAVTPHPYPPRTGWANGHYYVNGQLKSVLCPVHMDRRPPLDNPVETVEPTRTCRSCGTKMWTGDYCRVCQAVLSSHFR